MLQVSTPSADPDSLLGCTVRSRFTGNVFVVTHTDFKGGRRVVCGEGGWASLDAVTIIKSADRGDPR
jgi:hypothetical protein